MSVLRKYNPTTEQWEILQGGVQGVQGTPASLTKGTVTTGAPGTNANFTVTGTPPNQKLNLTIPQGAKGDTGNPSTYLIVGPGRPDYPETTGGAVTGSEPVGTEYRSTDGAGTGAWVWRKGRGYMLWHLIDGDTGTRHLDVTATWPEYPEGTTLSLHRTNNTVIVGPGRSGSSGAYTWDMGVANAGAGFLEFPSGFEIGTYPVISDIYASFDTDFGTKVGSVMAKTVFGMTRISLRHDAPRQLAFELRWTTPSGWPTTLPGTPG